MNDGGLYMIGEGDGVPHGASGLEPLGAEAEGARYHGVIIIEWPASYGYSPYSAMPGALLSVFDAVTGKPIITCLGVTIHADQAAQVTADLLMLCDGNGQPDYDAGGWAEGDDFPTGVFPFLVSEMRVRPGT